MITLGLYKGENLPYFKEFELDLDIKGVTLIRGKNLNAKNVKDRNNGSGKSLLLSGLSEILMNSNPAIERNELFARKALFPFKNSKITLEINKTLIMKGRFNSATVGYSIEADNGSLEKVKKDVALDHLLSVVNYNEDLFYTLVYLDGGREFPLIVGTSVQRLQFLSNIFPELEIFEQYYSYFSDKLRDINKQVNTLSVLESELEELTEKSSNESNTRLDTEATEVQLKKLRKKIKAQGAKVKELSKKVSDIEMYTSYEKTKTKIDKLEVELGIKSNESQDKYQYYLDNNRKASEYSEWVKKVKKSKSIKEGLERSIEEMELMDLDDSALSQQNTAKYKNYPEYISSTLTNISFDLGSDMKVDLVSNAKQAREAKIWAEFFSSLLERSPSNLIKNNPFNKLSDLSVEAVVDYGSQLKKCLDLCNTIIDKNLDLKNKSTVTDKDIEKAKAARNIKRKLKQAREELEEESNYYNKLRNKSLKKVTDVLDAESLSKLRKLSEYASLISAMGITDEVHENLDTVLTEYHKESELLSDLNTEYVNINSEYKFAIENQSTLDTIKSKISSLEKFKVAQAPLDLLKQAFSNKGVRVQMIHTITQKLASSMNENSHLTFPEPVEFRFDVTEKSCDIYVIRNPNTNFSVESDIRVLSRGERKSFNLLMLYCMLPLMPKSRRFNIVVMDEMVANMDMVTKTKIFREYIPALRERIPHIVIADTSNLEIDDANEYWVVKEGNVSQLISSDSIHRYE